MKLPNLERAVIEVFGGCNYHCKMCPQTTGRGCDWTVKMPLPLFERILDQLPGKPIINLDGSGEALLVNDLPKYIKACTSRGLDTYVYTNGSRLTGQFMRDCIDAGLTFIRVSCIGYNKETFNEWTGTDNYELIRSNLLETKQYIIENNKSCSLNTYHLILNEKQLTEEAMLYRKNFIEYAGITGYIWKMHNWSGNYSPDYNRTPINRKSCGRPFSPDIVIRAGGIGGLKGAVTPCCQTMGPPNEMKSVLGHAEIETLEEIWYGTRYENLRRLHNEKRFDETGYCGTCDFLYDDPEVLVWSNDPTASTNFILGTKFKLSDYMEK